MGIRIRAYFGFLFLAVVCLLSGCDDHRPRTVPVTSTDTQTQLNVDPESFGLEAVIALIKGEDILDPSALEATINNEESGINNVDVDEDGKVDHVQVQEEAASDGGKKFNFAAIPSSGTEPVMIATITMRQVNSSVVVEGGYPAYIPGHDRYYYTDTYEPTTLGFTYWVFYPRPVYYAPSYLTFRYSPRAVVHVDTFRTRRSSYLSETRVSPVRVQPRPSSFNATARELPSRFKSTRAPNSDRLGDRGGSRDFRARDTNRPQSNAPAFGGNRGGSPAPRQAAPPSRPSAPSRPASRPSGPSYRGRR